LKASERKKSILTSNDAQAAKTSWRLQLLHLNVGINTMKLALKMIVVESIS